MSCPEGRRPPRPTRAAGGPGRVPFPLWAAAEQWALGFSQASRCRAEERPSGGLLREAIYPVYNFHGRPSIASSLPQEHGAKPALHQLDALQDKLRLGTSMVRPGGVGLSGASPQRRTPRRPASAHSRFPVGMVAAVPTFPARSFSAELSFGELSLEFPGSSPEKHETAQSRRATKGWGHFPCRPARAGCLLAACWPPA